MSASKEQDPLTMALKLFRSQPELKPIVSEILKRRDDGFSALAASDYSERDDAKIIGAMICNDEIYRMLSGPE